MKTYKSIKIVLVFTIIICCSFNVKPQDKFTLKSSLTSQHPRILFTQHEADERAQLAKKYMKEDWDAYISSCKEIKYPTKKPILGQQQWWYFSKLAIAIGLTQDKTLISKGTEWLAKAVDEKWAFDSGKTVGLDVAHKLAGFALLYDCMYNYLSESEKSKYEKLLREGLVKFRTHGYDIGDYWTNDYQNNHMHFRATASLFSTIILFDKYPELQTEYDSVKTIWKRIEHMAPHDGSNHEGLGYSNYGGQMVFPGIFALKHCTEMDLTKSEHYHNVGYYYLYHIVPGMASGFGFGDSENTATASGPNYLFQIASLTKDPHIQYLANHLRGKFREAFYWDQWYILYYDPMLKEKDFSSLPLHRYFDDIGIAITRSDWGEDATAVAFKCGPMGGKLLNETRGTEYSHFSDYVNVAHDDPDAGTFLLFSKGQFLTTGDGYEKKNKITSQHSTFIIDDADQYGAKGGWSQPVEDISKYAWQKDFFAVNNRVVFSGDMKGVYPDMEKLDRVFVSQKAKYIVIYDNAKSKTKGRTFEWRLQTEGALAKINPKKYNIENKGSSALTQLLFPEKAEWRTTENKIGNILFARLENQTDNEFLVLLSPNPIPDSQLNKYNTATTTGVRVKIDECYEYTLFQKDNNIKAEAEQINFSGDVLLLTEHVNNNSIKSATLINGTEFSFDSKAYFSSDNAMNFGIDSISKSNESIFYTLAPSSSTDSTIDAQITIGALVPHMEYYLFKEKESKGNKIQTNSKGQTTFSIQLDTTIHFSVSKNADGGN